MLESRSDTFFDAPPLFASRNHPSVAFLGFVVVVVDVAVQCLWLLLLLLQRYSAVSLVVVVAKI